MLTRRSLIASAGASLLLSAMNSPVGDNPIVSHVPYAFPFEDYESWLAFMDKAPDPAWRADAMRRLIPEDVFLSYRDQKTLRTEQIVYLNEGLRINGFAVAPRQIEAPLPVILYAHGGVAQWGRITFFDLLELHRLAEQGYVVIASALRGEGGSEGKPNLGAGDLSDMLRLLDVAAHIDGADTARVGLWGFSRGGGLGYRMIAASDRIAAAVLVGASSDLVGSPRRQEFDTHVYPGIVDNYATDKDAALRTLSAVYWPERLSKNTRLLLIHGADDERVPVRSSLVMAQHLSRLKRDYQLLVLENGSHTLIEHQLRVRREIDRWFAAYLRT
ncbi:MAG: alpha/beta fold hydrolase [Sphingomonadales bacterium]|nr:alpha/beta fold hydrolase [Sphingomonadales bacterium]